MAAIYINMRCWNTVK